MGNFNKKPTKHSLMPQGNRSKGKTPAIIRRDWKIYQQLLSKPLSVQFERNIFTNCRFAAEFIKTCKSATLKSNVIFTRSVNFYRASIGKMVSGRLILSCLHEMTCSFIYVWDSNLKWLWWNRLFVDAIIMSRMPYMQISSKLFALQLSKPLAFVWSSCENCLV